MLVSASQAWPYLESRTIYPDRSSLSRARTHARARQSEANDGLSSPPPSVEASAKKAKLLTQCIRSAATKGDASKDALTVCQIIPLGGRRGRGGRRLHSPPRRGRSRPLPVFCGQGKRVFFTGQFIRERKKGKKMKNNSEFLALKKSGSIIIMPHLLPISFLHPPIALWVWALAQTGKETQRWQRLNRRIGLPNFLLLKKEKKRK